MRGPNTCVSAPMVDTITIASTNTPVVTTSSRLRSRSSTGLGRWLRGTDHATFSAFCSACPSPSEPYVAARIPTTVASVEPCSRSGRPRPRRR